MEFLNSVGIISIDLAVDEEIKLKNFSGDSYNLVSVSGNSSVGRASAFQAEGRGFESRFPLIIS